MAVCLCHVETIIRNRFFFVDLSLYMVKEGDTLPSNRCLCLWQTQWCRLQIYDIPFVIPMLAVQINLFAVTAF